ncbi:MAG: hypothetical protein K0B09_14945, partial [Bacteroidales bacterium]|nr:hypothetical protein [Bacteroidales bacterium]
MKRIFTLIFVASALFAQAQYATPGTGVRWDLETLAENSGGVVFENNGHYELNGSVVISANDTLEILTDLTLLLHDLSYIESYGVFIVDAPNQAVFSAIDPESTGTKWRGIRLYEGHYTYLRNATFEYGGGIKINNGGTFHMDACTLRYNYYLAGSTSGSLASGGALDISGPATIENCSIYSNQRAAIASASNVASPIIFRNNYLFGNTTENSNRPQINLGPAGPGNTTHIVGNTVIGNGFVQSGGIAYSSLLGVAGDVVIDSNYVEANRYGITITGSGMNGWIRHNTLIDNNIQNNPALGGSGINLTASAAAAYQHVMVTGNMIEGNLWGITIIGYPVVNMGNNDPENYNPGLNVFSGNGNGGVTYDLYNNGPVNQMAMGNLWDVAVQDAESIETVVTHQADDLALGLVTFMPAAQKVTFSATGSGSLPLEGVSIAIEGWDDELITDTEGLAELLTMQGSYSFTASLEGYNDFVGTFELGATTLLVPIEMVETTYTLTFAVTDGTEPLQGAMIAINEEELLTNEDGIASIDLLPGEYSYEVSLDGYETFAGNISIIDADVTLDVELEVMEYSVNFIVTVNGNPLEGASIEIAGETLTTDANGEATLLLVNGSYPYEVTATN